MGINYDFKDLFKTLNTFKVKFLIVGAYAVTYYREPRFTKDVDILVEPSRENAERVYRALVKFGAPLKGVTKKDFSNPKIIYQIGIEPNRIDIMMGIKGVRFSTAWKNRVKSTYGKEKVYILGLNDLIRTKKKSGRPIDYIDLKLLQKKE